MSYENLLLIGIKKSFSTLLILTLMLKKILK